MYLLYISDRIKRLISIVYPYHLCLNKGIRNETDVPQYLVQDPFNAIAPRIQLFCFLTPVNFKHCNANRNKIRWLKVNITISNRWPQQFTDLIWNWKVLKRPTNQGLSNNTEKISECCVRKGFN